MMWTAVVVVALLAGPESPATMKEQLRATFTRIEGDLKKARAAKDTLKQSCIESKLVEMKRLAREAFVPQQSSPQPSDAPVVNVDPAMKQALAKERIDLLAVQASECIGAESLGATETKVGEKGGTGERGATGPKAYDTIRTGSGTDIPLYRPPTSSPTE